MPSDLAEEDEDMKKYFGCILADLHGKDSERYSVSHDEAFIRPKEGEVPLPQVPGTPHKSHKEPVEDDDSGDDLGDFVFECSSQPLPPFFQFPDREGHFLKVGDLRSFLHGRLDMKRIETIVDMTREDFFRNAHSCLLGHKKAAHGNSKANKDEATNNIVQLAQVDDGVRKMLGIESVDVKGGRRSPSPPSVPFQSHKSHTPQKSPKSQMSPPPQPPPPPATHHQRLPIKPRLLAAALTSPSKARRKQL